MGVIMNIRAIHKNGQGYDVFIEEAGIISVFQSFADDDNGRLSFQETEALYQEHPELAEAEPVALNAQRVREITARLEELDKEITRVEEDIVDKIGLELAPKRKASREEKVELRKELASL